MHRRTAAVLLAALIWLPVGCGGSTPSSESTNSAAEATTHLTADSAAQALRDAGFKVSFSPLPSGSGIDTVLFVDLTADARVEVAIFTSVEAAQQYAEGLEQQASNPITRIGNSIVLPPSGVEAGDRNRLEQALRSAR